MDKTTISFWDSSEQHAFYTDSKPKQFNMTKLVGTVALMVLGIEETICKTVIKLVIDLLA